MKRSLLLLSVLLLAGCDQDCDSNPTAPPSPVTETRPSPAPSQTAPVITWKIERTAAHAGGEVFPSVATASIQIARLDGTVVATPKAGEHFNLGSAFGWYQVRGMVPGNSLWSAWFAFEIAANPCGECIAPPPPPPPVDPKPCQPKGNYHGDPCKRDDY